MTTLFSIIVPTYNRADLICETIDSILKQRYKNFEIIIVDDGSTDHTEKVIHSSYDRVNEIRYIKQKNAERGAARNLGVKYAKGDYVNFFDSDDLMLDNHLLAAQDFVQDVNPEVFHLNYEIRNEEGKVTGAGPAVETANRDLIKGNFLSCNGVLIRKDIALANPFSEDRELSAMEDWELWLRLASKYTITMMNKVTSVIVNHDERSVLQTNKDKLISRVENLIGKVTKNPDVMAYYKKDISKFEASCYTYVALHIALTKRDRMDTVKFTLKGIMKNPSWIFTRRFLAIIKHFI